jgi:hypothetical protein
VMLHVPSPVVPAPLLHLTTRCFHPSKKGAQPMDR